jgi:hypothetical protein
MARTSKTYGEMLSQWEALLTVVDAHLEELQHLEQPVTQLRTHLVEGRAAIVQQDDSDGERQLATKRLLAAINKGRKLASLIRLGLKNHYGYDAEQLVKFGVKPFRSRGRTARPAEPTEKPEPDPTTPPPDETPA